MSVIVLTELAHGGDAVGHVEMAGERRAVFVRGGAPGDRVELEIDFAKRPARGSLLRIVEASAERVVPPCKHASRCGGCDWMHVSHDGQLRAHEAHVREAVGEGVSIEVHVATRTEGYRERARLHVRVNGSRAIVGPNEARRSTALDVDACIALHPTLDAARAQVAKALEGARGTGDVGLALGALREARRAVLELRFFGELPDVVFGRIERWCQDGFWDGARIWTDGARAPAVIGDPTPWAVGIDGEPLRLASGGFAQAHGEVNRALGDWVTSQCVDGKLIELYAGSGNLTVGLARRSHVIAVESDEDAALAARANLAARGLEAKITCADAEKYVWPGDTAMVVLDPPRTGAKVACEALAKSKVKRIVYVSCDPPTLGRDLEILRERFTVRAAAMFEMFPQTSHVERGALGARAQGMKTVVDETLRDEAERFQLRFRCEDCVHFDGEHCSHGYPTEPHRQSLLGPFVFFCKEHEIR